jgi:hypothetical protein
MASDPRTGQNDLAAIWADSNSDLSAMVWNGAAWENEPAAALETSLQVVSAAQDVEDFAVQYESLSGNIMAVWGNSAGSNGVNGVRYARAVWTGGSPLHTWGAVTTPPTFLDDAVNLDLAANPASNEMVFASLGIAGAGLQVGYWSGSAWTDTANRDTSTAVPAAGTKLVAAAWISSGTTTRSVVAYNDSAATNIGYYTGNAGTFTAATDVTPVPVFANPQKYYAMQRDPVNPDRLMLTVTDGASGTGRLFAKRLTMTSGAVFAWTNADGGAALETALSSPTVGGASFAYWPGPPVTTFVQSAYRFFANADTTDVGAPLAPQDLLAVLPSSGTAFRLRALLNVGQVDLPLNGQAFKLQYAGRGDGTCDAPSNGTPAAYVDVSSYSLVAFNNNTPADGAALTVNANDPQYGSLTTVPETYVEANNSTNTVSAIARNQAGEWDFALKDNGMASGSSYCLKLVKADGSDLNSYGVYPEVMVQPAVYINEVYPSGAAGAQDWVEFYNNSASTVALAGWKLNYVESTIALGGTPNTVWTGQPADSVNAFSTFTVYGFPMNLVSGQSYYVELRSAAGTLADQVQWPVLSAGQSFARVTDGDPSFFEIDPTPTPGYANAVSTDGLKINEVSYGALAGQFVELYNASAVSTRTLGGYSLRNAAASGNGLVFRFTRRIYPHDYAVIDFSSVGSDGRSFTDVFGPQGLSASGDFLTLENSTGSAVDSVVWQSNSYYTRYNYQGQPVSAGNFAPANAASSVIRRPSEGADTGSDAADFAAAAYVTPASRNNSAGTAAANTLSYPLTSGAQVLARKFPLRLALGAASSGAGNNLLFERTGGAADAASPHLYRLQDIGFNLDSLAAQATVQVGAAFYDQDGAPLVSSAVYRVTLNSDTGAASAPPVVLSTVTYDASVHYASGSVTAPVWFNNASRAAVIKLDVANNSPAGFNAVQLSTISFKLLDSALAPLTSAQARGLFNAVMLVRDSTGTGVYGVYEPAIDLSTVAYVPMASISLDTAGVSTLTVPSAYLGAAAVPAASTSSFYLVLESTQNASAASPYVFRVSFDPAAALVADVPSGQQQDISAAAQVDTASSTLISPAQPPAGSTWPYAVSLSGLGLAPAAYYTNTGDTAISSAVYVSASDGYLRALKKDGTFKWTYATSPLSAIRTSPNAVVEGTDVYVYFADDNGDVYKVKDGETSASLGWKQSLGTPVKSNIMCTDLLCTGSKIYFGAGDNTVRCLNKTDGTPCSGWTYASAVTAAISGTISIDDRSTIKTGWIGLEDGKMVALQTETGTSPTSYQTGGTIKSSPYLDARVESANNVLYFTSADGKLYARVSSNLSSVPSGWTDYPTGGAAIYTSPTLNFEGSPKYVFFGDDAGRLHKVDAATGAGAPGWPFQAGGAIRSSPVWAPASLGGGQPYVYFGCDDGYIYAVNANTGALRSGWPVATGGPVRSDPVLDPDALTLIVSSNDGKTYTLYVGP